jgi:hypothetical protein
MSDPSIVDVDVSDEAVTVWLDDARKLSTPLIWYPRLHAATPDQRQGWEIVSAGLGVSWPSLDEDLSLAGMLAGRPAWRHPQVSAAE